MANKIKSDRFGNPFQVIGCKDYKGTGFAAGIIELGGKRYKLEPSPAQKEGVEFWVRVTQIKKQPKLTSM